VAAALASATEAAAQAAQLTVNAGAFSSNGEGGTGGSRKGSRRSIAGPLGGRSKGRADAVSIQLLQLPRCALAGGLEQSGRGGSRPSHCCSYNTFAQQQHSSSSSCFAMCFQIATAAAGLGSTAAVAWPVECSCSNGVVNLAVHMYSSLSIRTHWAAELIGCLQQQTCSCVGGSSSMPRQG
jgi:hypothetical protein